MVSVGCPAAPYGEVSAADYLLWTMAEESESWPDPPSLQHIRRVAFTTGG